MQTIIHMHLQFIYKTLLTICTVRNAIYKYGGCLVQMAIFSLIWKINSKHFEHTIFYKTC